MVILQPDRYWLKKNIKTLAHHITGRVLDIGSGPVLRYKNLFKYSEYVKVDIEPANKPDVIASVTDLPFTDATFDSVVMTQVLGDIYDFKKAISEVARVLKPGGCFLLSESLINETHNEPHDYWRFTEFSIKKMLGEAGLNIIELHRRGGFWSSSAQNLIRYLINGLKLYERKTLGNLFKIPIYIYARFFIWLDSLDTSANNKKFTIGYTLVARKK